MSIPLKKIEKLLQEKGVSLKEALELTRILEKSYDRLKYQEAFPEIAAQLIQLAKRLTPINGYYQWYGGNTSKGHPINHPSVFEYREFYLSHYCFQLTTNKLNDRETLEIIDLEIPNVFGEGEFLTVFEVVAREYSVKILTHKNLLYKQLQKFKQKLEKLLLINEL